MYVLGIVSPLVAFIMPSILYIKVRSMSKDKMTMLSKVLHGLIAVFGLFGCVIATYQTIAELASSDGSDPENVFVGVN